MTPGFFNFVVLTFSMYFEVFIQLIGRERKRTGDICGRFSRPSCKWLSSFLSTFSWTEINHMTLTAREAGKQYNCVFSGKRKQILVNTKLSLPLKVVMLFLDITEIMHVICLAQGK